MNRSSPVNVAPISEVEPPAFIARAARYSPTGQPSVRRTSSATSASGSSMPTARNSEFASGWVIDRSSTPTSTKPPCERSRAAGSGKASREPMAICEPSGSPTARAATASRLWRFVTASRWSRTRDTGWFMPAIAAASRRGPLISASDAATVRNTAGSIPSIRCNAAAT